MNDRATKLIAQVKERERLEAAAEAEGDDSEAEDGGVEIEGLGTEGQRAPRRNEEEESGSDEEDDVPKPVKRRPIIELQ